MEQPLVSIILCVYNGAATVGHAVESVLAQDYQHWELICVDDGSTDGSAGVIERAAAHDERIHIVRRSHQGLTPSKNAGYAINTGEIITFLAADDWYEPTHLSENIGYLLAHPEADALTSTAHILGDPYVPDMRDLTKLIHLDECVMGGTMFIKRNILESVLPFPEAPYGADYLLHQRMLEHEYTIPRLSLRTYVYDRRGENSITKRTAQQFASRPRH